MTALRRDHYAALYGPTTGDRLRLADTNLVVRIEEDAAVYGEEAAFGGGKSIRDGMEQSSTLLSRDGAPDTVITNVIVIDPVLGVRKADIGIKAGRIVAVGQSGNPDIMDNITPGLVIGAGTEIIAGEHMKTIAESGWGKKEIREFVWTHTRNSHAHLKRTQRMSGAIEPGDETKLRPLVASPDDLLVVAAGGRAGAFSCFIPGWASATSSQAVTKEIKR